MTRPADIPVDIRRVASSVYDRLGRGVDADEAVIAKALMDERERCADRYRSGSGPNTWDYFAAAEEAIRTPPSP